MNETDEIGIKGEGRQTELNPNRIVEFLKALPAEGVIFHGTVAQNSESVKKEGLGKTPSSKVDYFSFKPSQDTSPDNLSAEELKDIQQKFIKSVEKAIFWSTQRATLRAFYDESFSRDAPKEFIMNYLPAVVVARQPDNVLEVVRKNTNDHFDWETSGPIPAENILMVASLTEEEFFKLKKTMSGTVPDVSEFDTGPETREQITRLDEEARGKMARVLAIKILDQSSTTQH